MENALKKKFNLRKIFKEVVGKCLEEAKDVMEKEVTEERLDMLNSYYERRTNRQPSFEEETVSYKDFRR